MITPVSPAAPASSAHRATCAACGRARCYYGRAERPGVAVVESCQGCADAAAAAECGCPSCGGVARLVTGERLASFGGTRPFYWCECGMRLVSRREHSV